MDLNRKQWNHDLQTFRRALADTQRYQQSIDLFMSLHARVHTAKISRDRLWSFEDEVWQDASDQLLRRIPPNGEHSIAWITWHISRIEDVTMNLLVAGTPQLFQSAGWLERINAGISHTGNAMDQAAVADLSGRINLRELRAYRLAVGRRTRQIVQRLDPLRLKQKVDPKRLERVRAEGAVMDDAGGVLDYWGTRTIAGLLLMPATRHVFLHWNEALRIK